MSENCTLFCSQLNVIVVIMGASKIQHGNHKFRARLYRCNGLSPIIGSLFIASALQIKLAANTHDDVKMFTSLEKSVLLN